MTYNVESSNIKTISYEANSKELVVEYLSGHKYAYSNVPQTVLNDLLSSVSKGKYMNQMIKGQYEGRRIS